ncbi:MAG: hypothetical protein LBU34_13815 [Planctomycetaceae bacterium]|jgi:hypothetical protein|nr:hypothetical protein [Planctomycetaceae bacterium]
MIQEKSYFQPNFLLGDGAVRSVSVTTDRDRILVLLSNPVDGRSVAGGF